jgi:alkylation response protein AidB-like acyl-CoA dehydrogenase
LATIAAQLAEGSLIGTLAVAEQEGHDLQSTQTTARMADKAWWLTGMKHLVPYGAVAEWALVGAQTADGLRGFGMMLMPPGARVEPISTLGGDHRATLWLEAAQVPMENIVTDLAGIVQRAAVTRAAYLVGMGEAVLQLSTTYAKERVQFGRPIGAFQAVQHRLADIAIQVQGARYVTYQAAARIEQGDLTSPRLPIALAYTREAILDCCMQSHQVHGAIGFTNEYDLQLYSRRARVWLSEYGTPDLQRAAIARAESIGGY